MESVPTQASPGGPRERLGHVGVEGLSDAELLALLIGTGSRREPVHLLAPRLLHEIGGVRALGRLGAGALEQLAGLGPSKASRIASSRDVDAALRPRLASADTERFLAIALDAKNRPVSEIAIARGGLSACPVSPSDVFRALIREAAAGVVFVHNHPSGEPSPSPDDVALTDRLRRAGELLSIHVLDHVIIGREGYFSFLDAGLLEERAR